MSPLLVKWPYVIGDLWVLVAQSPWPSELGAPSVGCMCPIILGYCLHIKGRD